MNTTASTSATTQNRGQSVPPMKRRKGRARRNGQAAMPKVATPGQQSSKARKQQNKKKQKDNQKVFGGLETRKQARGDPRMGQRVQHSEVGVLTSQKSVAIQAALEANSIWGWSKGYVVRALERGYAASASIPQNPYWAYVYLSKILAQFAAGGIPAVAKLPYVVLAFGRALSPKSAGLDLGKASFAFTTLAAGNPLSQQVIGFAPYGFQWTLGYVPTVPVPINGFPLLSFAGLGAPTDDQAQAAFAEMNLFLTNSDTGNPAYRSVALNEKTRLDNDVSTFTFLTSAVGYGSGGSGTSGFGGVAALEVPIFRPFLAAFNQYNFTDDTNNRWSNLNVPIAGDSLFVGASMSSLIHEKDWGFKRYPKFHAVDFLEFGEVLAMWVQAIQQAAMNDPTGQWAATEATPAQTIASYQCPLTLQEMFLLLRNVMMTAFKDTQAGVQGLGPYLPSSGTDNQFVPFGVSAGTCLLTPIDMKLPRAFVENIRALVYRITHRSATDLEYFIPVLGQYAMDVIVSAPFTYTGAPSGGAPITTPSFASGALFKKKVFDEKTETWSYKPMVEDAISLVDGSCTAGFVALNNPEQLKALVMMWNKWLGEKNLTSYSSALTTFGTDPGVNILYSGNMTRHWTVPAPDMVLANKEKRFVDVRLERREYAQVMLSNYASRLAVADTSQTPFIAAAYEQFQNTWILPLIENEFDNSTNVQNSTIVPRWQSLMRETHLQNFSSGTDGQSLSQLHQSYANKMTKGKQDQLNDWDKFFDQCETTGDSGILSGLVGGALSALFPKAAGVINAVANVVPF